MSRFLIAFCNNSAVPKFKLAVTVLYLYIAVDIFLWGPLSSCDVKLSYLIIHVR